MQRSLDTDLILRPATPADIEALVAFNADVSRYQDTEQPDATIAAWTRDLLEHRHPHCEPSDFVIVEERSTGRIVSAATLISQTWTYAGLEIEVGQPELVGTLPDYRGRGLVREQLAAIHEHSATRGQHLLAIDGIPAFYRQFGYEMALALRGEFSIDATRIPPPGTDPGEVYRVRAARRSDLGFVVRTYEHSTERYMIACPRNVRLWEYEFAGRSERNPWRYTIALVETSDGQPVGLLAHAPQLARETLGVPVYELAAGTPWADVTPSVLRYLRKTGDASAAQHGLDFRRVGLCLGDAHPAYAVIGDLAPRDEGAYAWYLRVRDLPSFVRRIAPGLERRLSLSAWARYSGELRLSFSRAGLRLAFEGGRLTEVAAWRQPAHLQGVEKGVPTRLERWTAVFPGLTFLQLLFGYRALSELQHAFADCVVRTDETREVLQTLFPKLSSNVWPVL